MSLRKQNNADYLGTYDARMYIPSNEPRDHDFSPDEEKDDLTFTKD